MLKITTSKKQKASTDRDLPVRSLSFGVFIGLQIALSALAFQRGDLNVHLGTGISGSRGITGLSIERFLTPNHVVSVATGIDSIGMTMTGGYKYMWNPYNEADRDKWYGRCLFLFECDDHLYAGIQAQFLNKTEVTVKEGANSNLYLMDPRSFAMIVLGDRNRFTNDVTLDFEISYRTLVSGGGHRLVSGTAGQVSEPPAGAGLGFGIAIGYNF